MYKEITDLTFLVDITIVFLIRLLCLDNGFVTVKYLDNGYRKEKNDQQERYHLAIF